MHVRSFEKLFPEIPTGNNSPFCVMSGKHPQGRLVQPRTNKQNQLHDKKPHNRVLIVGRMRELALYRAEVLRHDGFQVRTPETKEEAMAIIEHGDFDVAVLSYTLPNDTVQEVADHVREHCPNCPIVAIAETSRLDRRIAPDAIALAAEGPPGLLSALHKVLKQS